MQFFYTQVLSKEFLNLIPDKIFLSMLLQLLQL